MSERLEVAAKAVTEACKALVKLVRAMSAKQVEEDVDYQNVAVLEFEKREMEQLVETFGEGPRHGETAGGHASCRYHTEETD